MFNVLTDIVEVCRYIGEMRVSVSNLLPARVSADLEMAVFSHIAALLSRMLFDAAVTVDMHISFLESLHKDLDLLAETVSKDLSIAMNQTVMETLAEVRESVALVVSDHTHDYLDPMVRSRRYPNVRTARLVVLLQKYVL